MKQSSFAFYGMLALKREHMIVKWRVKMPEKHETIAIQPLT